MDGFDFHNLDHYKFMLILNNSLYFISRHFKQFSVPRVIISELSINGISAYYDWTCNDLCYIDNEEFYISNGLIVISYDTSLPIETLLLHEYRHHLQFCLNGSWTVPDWVNGESLEDYNHNNVFEKDARLFEVSLGRLDEFTDEFKTVKVNRSHMLNLPTRSFLARL